MNGIGVSWWFRYSLPGYLARIRAPMGVNEFHLAVSDADIVPHPDRLLLCTLAHRHHLLIVSGRWPS